MSIRRHKILTVPNLLSLFRLLLIPFFLWLYQRGAYIQTAAVLVLSGLTDVADGWYARHFHAISDLGKVLDPAADKLTQLAMLLFLSADHPLLIFPLILLVVKELFACVSGAIMIRRTERVPSALWHGKATTLLLYLLMFLHVIWKEIPAALSNILTVICVMMMLISMTLYGLNNIQRIQSANKEGS